MDTWGSNLAVVTYCYHGWTCRVPKQYTQIIRRLQRLSKPRWPWWLISYGMKTTWRCWWSRYTLALSRSLSRVDNRLQFPKNATVTVDVICRMPSIIDTTIDTLVRMTWDALIGSGNNRDGWTLAEQIVRLVRWYSAWHMHWVPSCREELHLMRLALQIKLNHLVQKYYLRYQANQQTVKSMFSKHARLLSQNRSQVMANVTDSNSALTKKISIIKKHVTDRSWI